jgi:D-alanine transaminase
VARRELRVGEMMEADEVMIGFATRGVLPVTRIDGHAVGRGTTAGLPGPVWQQLQAAFLAHLAAVADLPFDAPEED